MTLTTVKTWLKQPSTIKGIAAVVGVAATGICQILTHQVELSAGIGALVYGVVHIVMPDNTAMQTPVEKLVTDAAVAIATQKLAAAIPLLLSDVAAIGQAVTTTATVTQTTSPAVVPAAPAVVEQVPVTVVNSPAPG